MQEGSIVIMKRPLPENEQHYLLMRGLKYPTPGDQTHVVTMLKSSKKIPNTQILALDTFPEIFDAGIVFYADLFEEVMPPDDSVIDELVEEVNKETL